MIHGKSYREICGSFFLRQNRREKNILFYEEERVRPKRTIPLYFLEEILCWRTDLRPTW